MIIDKFGYLSNKNYINMQYIKSHCAFSLIKEGVPWNFHTLIQLKFILVKVKLPALVTQFQAQVRYWLFMAAAHMVRIFRC